MKPPSMNFALQCAFQYPPASGWLYRESLRITTGSSNFWKEAGQRSLGSVTQVVIPPAWTA
eukprot:2765271-Heterocapsa_arctica.AAC.1